MLYNGQEVKSILHLVKISTLKKKGEGVTFIKDMLCMSAKRGTLKDTLNHPLFYDEQLINNIDEIYALCVKSKTFDNYNPCVL